MAYLSMVLVTEAVIASFVSLHGLPSISRCIDAVAAVRYCYRSLWHGYNALDVVASGYTVLDMKRVSCYAVYNGFEGGANFRAPCEMAVTMVLLNPCSAAAQMLRDQY